MRAIYGLYPDPDSAQRAVDSLRGAGISECDITIVSSEPFEHHEFGRREHRTAMPWLAALGGIIGGVAGFSFVAFSQQAYPLPTGGMPIVSLWPNGIITYELTMLGVILATLLTLLVSSRSPRESASLYDPAVSNGNILVGVVNPPEKDSALEKILREAGAAPVVNAP